MKFILSYSTHDYNHYKDFREPFDVHLSVINPDNPGLDSSTGKVMLTAEEIDFLKENNITNYIEFRETPTS